MHSPHYDAMYQMYSVHVLSSEIAEKSDLIPKNNYLFSLFINLIYMLAAVKKNWILYSVSKNQFLNGNVFYFSSDNFIRHA